MDTATSTSRVDGGRALDGTLDVFPLPSLFRLFESGKTSGVLVVATAPPTVLWWCRGRISVAADLDFASLQAALEEAAVLPPERLGLALQGQRSGNTVAANLLAAGASEPLLRDVIWDRTVETVFELLLPSRAHFWFEPATPPAEVPIEFTIGQVLTAAEERLAAWRVIAQVIPSTSLVAKLVDQLPPTTNLVTISREEWPVLAAIDGRRDVANIVNVTGLSAFGVCGVLHRLIELGVVALTNPA